MEKLPVRQGMFDKQGPSQRLKCLQLCEQHIVKASSKQKIGKTSRERASLCFDVNPVKQSVHTLDLAQTTM